MPLSTLRHGLIECPTKAQEFLKKCRDWERRTTTVLGIFVLRLPEAGNRPASLAVELNPVDSSDRPIKRRGWFLGALKSMTYLEDARQSLHSSEEALKRHEYVVSLVNANMALEFVFKALLDHLNTSYSRKDGKSYLHSVSELILEAYRKLSRG